MGFLFWSKNLRLTPHFMNKKNNKMGRKLSYKKIACDMRLVTQVIKSIYSFGLFSLVFHAFVLFVAAPLLFSLVCWVSLLHMGFTECECFIETQKRNKKVEQGFTEGKRWWKNINIIKWIPLFIDCADLHLYALTMHILIYFHLEIRITWTNNRPFVFLLTWIRVVFSYVPAEART